MKKSVLNESEIDEINSRLWNNRYDNPSETLKQSSKILTEAIKIDYQKGIAYSRLNIAACSFLQSENDLAWENLSRALLWFTDNNFELGYSWALNLKGTVHESFGDYENALQFCLKANKISVALNERKTIAETYSQLGLIYTRLSNYSKALEYYLESYKIREEMKDENAVASSLNRIGMVKRLTKEYDESLENYLKSLEIRRRNKQLSSVNWTLLGIASTYEEMQDLSEALKYYDQGMAGTDKRCSQQCILGLGRILSQMGMAEEAEKKLIESLNMALELKANPLVAEVYAGLAAHYESVGQFEKALENYKRYQETRESLLSNEARNSFRNIEISYAIEKSEHEKEIYRLKHIELKQAYDQIAEKNKYITESINYASYIQHAILPDIEEIKGMCADCFILYIPLEIVSGDFYWSNVSENRLIVAAGDCTGHGVPGALMSMLAISFLEEIVNYRKLTDSGKILDEMKKEVQRALHQKGSREEVKDGMDMSLCVFDRSNNSLQFSGAKNNIYLVRNNELIEFAADRMPIGIFEETDARFGRTDFNTFPGDLIYMFSDGYADQMGGPKHKRYKYATLKNFLLGISKLPLSVQKQSLEKEFYDWKGTNPQIDDILILGMKI